MRLTSDKRVFTRACVICKVRDDQKIILDKSMGADRAIKISLARLESYPSLEPLAIPGNKAHKGDRCLAEKAGKRDNVVKTLLGRRIKYVVAGEACKARRIYCVGRRRRHALLS